MILYRSEPDLDYISRFQKTTGVGQILDESFARCPEREAIVFGDWRITYRELPALIYRTAHCLRSLGIAPGERVAFSRALPASLIAELRS
jgi:Acyl-CoA synthetases (AMP-forming)/AMP-acid ligases II